MDFYLNETSWLDKGYIVVTLCFDQDYIIMFSYYVAHYQSSEIQS